MCQSEPQSSQAIAKGFGVEIVKPYDTPMGEPVRALVMTEEDVRGEARTWPQRVLKCFVDATKTFLEKPELAEKYVRDTMFKGQLTSRGVPAGDRQLALHLRHDGRARAGHDRPDGEGTASAEDDEAARSPRTG